MRSVAIILKLNKTATEYGGIAQLGERLNGIQEVSGSIPLISTKGYLRYSDEKSRNLRISGFFLFIYPLKCSEFTMCIFGPRYTQNRAVLVDKNATRISPT